MPQINTAATASTSMATIENAISQQQWANLRAKSRQQLPVSYQGAGLPDVLLGYQQDLFRFIEAHDVGIIEKSRRIGLTWGVGSKAVLYSAASITAGGMNTYYIGYNLEMARDLIDVCAMSARSHGLTEATIASIKSSILGIKETP